MGGERERAVASVPWDGRWTRESDETGSFTRPGERRLVRKGRGFRDGAVGEARGGVGGKGREDGVLLVVRLCSQQQERRTSTPGEVFFA